MIFLSFYSQIIRQYRRMGWDGNKANLDSAFKRSPHQFISGSDESVEYSNDLGGRDVGGEQRCVARISSAVFS
jgi:hypothetical protein